MQLRSLKLSNYRNHESSSFEFPKEEGSTILLLGKVGAGKTSVPAAIALCLAGRNYLTDGRGTGMDAQIRQGSDGLQIVCDFADGFTVIRSKSATDHLLSINMANVPNKIAAQQQAILMRLGLSDETLSALLDMTPFCSRKREEQKAFLLKVLRPEVFKLDESIVAVGKKYGLGAPSSIEEVQAAYERFYKMRTVAKKEQKEVIIPKQPELLEGVPDPAELKRQVDELRKTQFGLVSKISEANAAIKLYNDAVDGKSDAVPPTEAEEAAAKRAVADADSALRSVSDALRMMPQKLNAVKEPDGPPCTEEEAKNAQERCEMAMTAVTLTKERATALKAECERLEAAIAIAGDCPTCLQPVMAEHIGAMNDKLEALAVSFNAAKREYQEAKITLDASQKELERVTLKLSCALARELESREKVLKASKLEAEKKLDGISKARANVRLLERMEPKVSKAKTELPGLKLSLEDIERKIANSATVLDDASNLTRQIKEWNDANAAARICAEKVMDLERLVEYFSPAGVQKEMLSAWCAGFLESATERLGICGLGELAISMEPFMLTIGGIPMENLSGGQQLCFEVIWRLAVAELTGFGIAAIDGTNALGQDEEKIGALVDILRSAPKVQKFVTLTTPNVEAARPFAELPGSVIMIDAGTDGVAKVKIA